MNQVHIPKKEASLNVAVNTPIIDSCKAIANLLRRKIKGFIYNEYRNKLFYA